MKILILFFLFSITLGTYGEVTFKELIVNQLRTKGQLDPLLIPTYNLYQNQCCKSNDPEDTTCLGLGEAAEQMAKICKIVLKTEVCQEVPEEKRLDCRSVSPSNQISMWDFLVGCTTGLMDTIKDLLSLVWGTVKWSFEAALDSEFREEQLESANEYLGVIKLYLTTELQKAYDEARSPLRPLKAYNAFLGSVGKLIYNAISDAVMQQYAGMGCMNTQAKSDIMCRLIGDIFSAPKAALALITKGPQSIERFDSLRRAFEKIEEFKAKNLTEKRLKDAENALGRSLAEKPEQRNAIIESHNIGIGEKGKDGTPARIGNYTFGQLKRKAKILKDAGFTRAERRLLMEHGVVGLDEVEARAFMSLVDPEDESSPPLKTTRELEELRSGPIARTSDAPEILIDQTGQRSALPRSEINPSNLAQLFQEPLSSGGLGAKAITYRDSDGMLKTIFWNTYENEIPTQVHHRDAAAAVLNQRAENLIDEVEQLRDAGVEFESQADALEEQYYAYSQASSDIVGTAGSARDQSSIPNPVLVDFQGFQFTMSTNRRGHSVVSRFDVDSSLTSTLAGRIDPAVGLQRQVVDDLIETIGAAHGSIASGLRGYQKVSVKRSLYNQLERYNHLNYLRAQLSDRYGLGLEMIKE